MKDATRGKAVIFSVLGVAILVARVVYHGDPRLKEWGTGLILLGGGMIVFGVLHWLGARARERDAAEAESLSQMTMADYAAEGIPDTAPATSPWQLIAAIVLLPLGLALTMVGIGFLLLAASGYFFWQYHKISEEKRKDSNGTRFLPGKPAPALGGELRGEIRLSPGLQPSGPVLVRFGCERFIRVRQQKGPDQINRDSEAEFVRRNVEPAEWHSTGDGAICCPVVLPLRGGRVSFGPVPPQVYDKPSFVWTLNAEVPLGGTTRSFEFIIPVKEGAVAPPEIPPEMVEAARDILGPGNPEKVLGFVADKAVETPEVAGVAAPDIAAVLAAANIKETPKYSAVGGQGLQMDPAASRAAQRFMGGGVGCVMVMGAGAGLLSLFLLAIPYVGWLLLLAAFYGIYRMVRSAWEARQAIDRQAELLWVEPGHLCYMPDGATEYRVPLAEIDRLEIQWIGSAGSDYYVKLSAAAPAGGGAADGERTLLAHGILGMETARAVSAWLLERLGADLPVVEAQQGQEQLEKMRDWVKDPTKR